MGRGQKMMMLSFVVSLLMLGCMGSMEDEEKECADELTNLAACIPFVSGTSKKPTQQCCQDTQKVKSSKPKCLCVLIKESADPSLGLPVNTTLALQMPSVCNIDAKVSDCPSLLSLPPDSADAKIFKMADSGADSATDSPPSSRSASSSSSGSSSSADSKATPTSNDGGKLKLFGSGGTLLMTVVVMASIGWMFIFTAN